MKNWTSCKCINKLINILTSRKSVVCICDVWLVVICQSVVYSKLCLCVCHIKYEIMSETRQNKMALQILESNFGNELGMGNTKSFFFSGDLAKM